LFIEDQMIHFGFFLGLKTRGNKPRAKESAPRYRVITVTRQNQRGQLRRPEQQLVLIVRACPSPLDFFSMCLPACPMQKPFFIKKVFFIFSLRRYDMMRQPLDLE
jgi:hypothetical protein